MPSRREASKSFLGVVTGFAFRIFWSGVFVDGVPGVRVLGARWLRSLLEASELVVEGVGLPRVALMRAAQAAFRFAAAASALVSAA